jgi:hypothetical protein
MLSDQKPAFQFLGNQDLADFWSCAHELTPLEATRRMIKFWFSHHSWDIRSENLGLGSHEALIQAPNYELESPPN